MIVEDSNRYVCMRCGTVPVLLWNWLTPWPACGGLSYAHAFLRMEKGTLKRDCDLYKGRKEEVLRTACKVVFLQA